MRSRASLHVLKSTSTPVNCVSTFELFVRSRFTSCTSSSALWITVFGLWCAVSQYSTFNACANLRTKSYRDKYEEQIPRNVWHAEINQQIRDLPGWEMIEHVSETRSTCRFKRARSFNWISSVMLCSNCRIFLSYSLTFSSWYLTSRCRPWIVISFLPWFAYRFLSLSSNSLNCNRILQDVPTCLLYLDYVSRAEFQIDFSFGGD